MGMYLFLVLMLEKTSADFQVLNKLVENVKRSKSIWSPVTSHVQVILSSALHSRLSR